MTAQDHQETPTTAAGQQETYNLVNVANVATPRTAAELDEPQTDAGRGLVADMYTDGCSPACVGYVQSGSGSFVTRILAIEAEAAARQVTRLQAFEDTLADIDREPTPEEVRKYGLDGSPGTSFNTLQWKLDRFRLLSAGDKAEAPRDPLFWSTISAYEQSGLPGDWDRAQQMKYERALGIPVSDYSTDPLREARPE